MRYPTGYEFDREDLCTGNNPSLAKFLVLDHDFNPFKLCEMNSNSRSSFSYDQQIYLKSRLVKEKVLDQKIIVSTLVIMELK